MTFAVVALSQVIGFLAVRDLLVLRVVLQQLAGAGGDVGKMDDGRGSMTDLDVGGGSLAVFNG
jgi:hypothetical protein